MLDGSNCGRFITEFSTLVEPVRLDFSITQFLTPGKLGPVQIDL